MVCFGEGADELLSCACSVGCPLLAVVSFISVGSLCGVAIRAKLTYRAISIFLCVLQRFLMRFSFAHFLLFVFVPVYPGSSFCVANNFLLYNSLFLYLFLWCVIICLRILLVGGRMLYGLEQSCPLAVAVVKQLQSLGVVWDSGSQLVIALASCFYGKSLNKVPTEHLDIIALYQEFLANPVRFSNLSSYLPRQPLQLSLF